MTKTLTLFTFGLGLTGLSAMAQPILSSLPQPAYGSTVTNHVFNAQGVSAGSAGANQTWNFGSIQSTNQLTGTQLNPANTPYAASFPTATLATLYGSGYTYSKYTGTTMEALGSFDGQSLMVHSNPEKIMYAPFAYQQTFTDPWQLSYNFQGFTINRYGSTTVTYDGYGTLTTPLATTPNVMRFKLVQDSYDELQGDTIFYHQEGYMWMADATLTLFSVNKFDRTYDGDTETSYSGTYSSAAPASVEEFAANENLLVYPNPSSGEVTIQSEGLGFVNLISMEGKVIKGFPISATQTQLTLDLPTGMYVAECIYKDGHRATRRLVVQ